MQTEASFSSSEVMMPGALASAQQVASRGENLLKTITRLQLLTDYIWWYTEAHGGKEVAFLPESQRAAILPDAKFINPSLRKIAEDLEHNTVRTLLLKLMSSKTVQDFLDAAERYDEWLETLEMSLNHEFLTAIMTRMEPHIRETENAV